MDTVDTVARGEVAEAQIDTFIARADTKRRRDEGERREAELWQEGVDRFHAKARKENRARWYTFHTDMSELHSRLAAEHEAKAQKLLEGDTAA